MSPDPISGEEIGKWRALIEKVLSMETKGPWALISAGVMAALAFVEPLNKYGLIVAGGVILAGVLWYIDRRMNIVQKVN